MLGRLSGKFNSRDSQDPDFLRAYKLGKLLGEGAFAHVYRATRRPLEGDQPKDVAVKRIDRGLRKHVSNEVRLKKVRVIVRLRTESLVLAPSLCLLPPIGFFLYWGGRGGEGKANLVLL